MIVYLRIIKNKGYDNQIRQRNRVEKRKISY